MVAINEMNGRRVWAGLEEAGEGREEGDRMNGWEPR